MYQRALLYFSLLLSFSLSLSIFFTGGFSMLVQVKHSRLGFEQSFYHKAGGEGSTIQGRAGDLVKYE